MTITLEDGGTYMVQKALLCKTSRYFEAALEEGKFKEGQEKKLKLPGCSTKAFELLLYWICESSLPDPFEDIGEDPLPSGTARDGSSDAAQLQLVQLWAVADRLLLLKLQNDIVRQLLRIFEEFSIATATVQTAFEENPAESAIAKFILQQFAHDSCDSKKYSSAEMGPLGAAPGFFHAFNKKTLSTARSKSAGDCPPDLFFVKA